eukprot:175682-Hanusia_phi.AAC.1
MQLAQRHYKLKWVSNDFQNRRVIAVDPGRVTPFCGVEISPQGEHYEKRHIRKNNEKIKRWNKRAEYVNQALQMKSSASSKTRFDAASFERFLNIDMMFDDILWEHSASNAVGESDWITTSHTGMLRLHQLTEVRTQYMLNGSSENISDDIKHLMLTSSILRSVAIDVEVIYPTSAVDRFPKELNKEYIFEVSNH